MENLTFDILLEMVFSANAEIRYFNEGKFRG